VDVILHLHGIGALPDDVIYVDDFRAPNGARLPSLGVHLRNRLDPRLAPDGSLSTSKRAKASSGGGGLWSSLSSILWAEDEQEVALSPETVKAFKCVPMSRACVCARGCAPSGFVTPGVCRDGVSAGPRRRAAAWRSW
jgi:hypothetical protein